MADKPFDPYDWKTHRVADCPRLVEYQKYLNERGLKDPWIRNEVWRHLPHMDPRNNFVRTFGRGFFPGLFAAIVVTAGLRLFGSGSDHGH